MKYIGIAAALTALSGALSGALLGAQQAGDSTQLLPPVTVTATRAPTTIFRAPLATSIVGRDELRLTRGYGLDEAFRFPIYR